MTAMRELWEPQPGEFSWAGGIENTFIPQSRPGLRPLDEYELTQHYEQWRADLARAATLGIRKIRWGIPWYRVEPRPGHFCWDWIDEVLTYLVHDLQIQPIVDLMHYGTPLWLERSFLDEHYPEYVAAYAQAFVERYRGLVRFYTPLNEPTVNAEFCGRRGIWPPYQTGESGYVAVLLSLARGIQLSARAIRQADPGAVLVAVEAMNWSQPGTPAAREAAQFIDQQNLLCWDLVSGRVHEHHPLHNWLLAQGATRAALAQLQEQPIIQDILGVNFYPWSAHFIERDESGNIRTVPVPANGMVLADVLRRCHAHTLRPLFVTETSSPGDIDARAKWMDETLEAVQTVRAEGIPVIGYTWFPLMTMIDWDYRLTEQPVDDYLLHLGLWDAHFDDQRLLVREETPLVAHYQQVIQTFTVRDIPV